MTNQLINVTNQNGELLVSARDLHKGLGIGKDFSTWVKDMIDFGFDENVDFTTFWSDPESGVVVEYNGNVKSMNAKGYRIDYVLKLDMAKEICMVQRNELGKQFRRYFIECEKQLMNHSLPTPEAPLLIGQDPCNNYLIRKNINQLDTAEIPRYVNQIIEQAKNYKPQDRLNTYQLTRTALENKLPTLIESYDITIVRASLDKLNKIIENQKMYINRSKLGQATKTINKLKDTVQYYELDSYENYFMVDMHGYTVNRAYRAVNNEIKCTIKYKDWKDDAEIKMQDLPSFEEMKLDPLKPKKIDIYFYLKDETFDVSNCTKSFLDALEKHYKKECPEFNDNLFADVRTRKYFSYSGSYENSYIIFGIKDLTDDEIQDLTFDNDN